MNPARSSTIYAADFYRTMRYCEREMYPLLPTCLPSMDEPPLMFAKISRASCRR